ncbi:MAG: hypothetical protein AVDCRST_MAG37-2100, partial [uncultured Rubrobacteraceae bacterium]
RRTRRLCLGRQQRAALLGGGAARGVLPSPLGSYALV